MRLMHQNIWAISIGRCVQAACSMLEVQLVRFFCFVEGIACMAALTSLYVCLVFACPVCRSRASSTSRLAALLV